MRTLRREYLCWILFSSAVKKISSIIIEKKQVHKIVTFAPSQMSNFRGWIQILTLVRIYIVYQHPGGATTQAHLDLICMQCRHLLLVLLSFFIIYLSPGVANGSVAETGFVIEKKKRKKKQIPVISSRSGGRVFFSRVNFLC